MTDPSRRTLECKVVVLGASFVGKTSIIVRYCENTFTETHLSTIGARFCMNLVKLDDVDVTLSLWDTAGQERFRSIIPSLLRGANGAILVYDSQSHSSLDQLDFFYRQFVDIVGVESNALAPILLLGNKCDLGEGVIGAQTLAEWMAARGICFSYRVSAKTGEGIEKAMKEWIVAVVNAQSFQERSAMQIPAPAAERSQCC